MPAIPFLTTMPSQPASPSSAAPLASSTSEQAPSVLASSLEEAASSVMAPMDQQGDSQSESLDQGLSFWQTLQQTTEMADLPQGQSFAALSSHVSSVDEGIENSEIAIPALTSEAVQVEVTDMENVAINPLTIHKMTLAGEQVKSDDISMDFIESQRTAAPVYQAIDSAAEASTNTKGVHSLMTAQKQLISQEPVNGQSVALAETSAKILQPTHPLMDELSAATEEMTEEIEQGISLKSLGLDDKTVNIHEKPITLQKTDVIEGKAQFSAVNEVVQMAVAEGDEAAIHTNLTSKSTQVLQAKPSTEANAMAEKPSTHFKVDVPPSSPQWSEQIARRISIMSSEQIQSARIQLDPPELGLLEIKIKVQQDQVNVSFASGHQVVRDALENQAPRLKELMEQQGVDLTDVNVSDHGQQSNGGQGEEQVAGNGDGQEGEWLDGEEPASSETITMQSDSLVDDFA